MILMVLFCFKQKAAYEMRISDWSSDVCSSDLVVLAAHMLRLEKPVGDRHPLLFRSAVDDTQPFLERRGRLADVARVAGERERVEVGAWHTLGMPGPPRRRRQKSGRAHVLTPVTNAHIVCRLLLAKKKHYHLCLT